MPGLNFGVNFLRTIIETSLIILIINLILRIQFKGQSLFDRIHKRPYQVLRALLILIFLCFIGFSSSNKRDYYQPLLFIAVLVAITFSMIWDIIPDRSKKPEISWQRHWYAFLNLLYNALSPTFNVEGIRLPGLNALMYFHARNRASVLRIRQNNGSLKIF